MRRRLPPKMTDSAEVEEEAPWLAGPIMSRPRDQYISSMFSRNLLTRQISMRKTAYRPRYVERGDPLTPPATPTTARTTTSPLAEETEGQPPQSPRRMGPPPPPPPASSSPYEMLLDETTLDRPSIRLYRPDPVPEAVVAAAAAASATATGGLEAKAWRLVLVVSRNWRVFQPYRPFQHEFPLSYSRNPFFLPSWA